MRNTTPSAFDKLSQAIFEYRKSNKGCPPDEVFLNPYFRRDLIECMETNMVYHYAEDGKEYFRGVIITQRAQVEPISFYK